MAADAKRTQGILNALEARGQDPSGLTPIGVRPALAEYLAGIWARRHFIWMDARHRVATSNSRNRLGSLWLVLRPMFEAAMYYVIFAEILGVDRGMENFPGFIIIGILMFRSTMRAISSSPSIAHLEQGHDQSFQLPSCVAGALCASCGKRCRWSIRQRR